MDVQVFAQDDALAEASARWLLRLVRSQPDALICLAAGDTQRKTLARVVAASQAESIDFSRIRWIGLDEWIGLAADYPGSCHHFLTENIFGRLGIRAEQIMFFQATAADLAAECQRIDRYLDEQGPIDGLLLGLGRNGHLGMNEPGCDVRGRCQIVPLTLQTQSVGRKYFQPGQNPVLAYGITLGMADLLRSRQILLQASGVNKAPIIDQALHGPVSPDIPASLLRPCTQAACFLDADAASLWRQSPD